MPRPNEFLFDHNGRGRGVWSNIGLLTASENRRRDHRRIFRHNG